MKRLSCLPWSTALRRLVGIAVPSILLMLAPCVAGPARAQATSDFSTWLTALKADALAHGVSQGTVDQALSDVQPIDRVLELDRRQPEFTMTFEDYLGHVVSDERVTDGKSFRRQHKALLDQVARRYGVPARVLVAMWGIESNYGRNTGGFAVVPALATLAYDGRRSQYFRSELLNALKIVDRGMPAYVMQGSWAGAMGQCQFMPSTYLKFARKWQGGGEADIWREPADVFASAANYLSRIGWNPHETWGRAVQLPRRMASPRSWSASTSGGP